MTVYDEYGNAHTLEISDDTAVLEALAAQTEQLETLVESQADIISQLKAENEILTEMNTYCAYIFALVAAFVVYKILASALSSMFGGG